jgi:hypothetical protein
MTIVVVEAGARDCNSGMGSGDEFRILLRRTVVRNLDHVGVQIYSCAHNRLLTRRFHITGEQQPYARPSLTMNHQAAVILLGGLILIG